MKRGGWMRTGWHVRTGNVNSSLGKRGVANFEAWTRSLRVQFITYNIRPVIDLHLDLLL
jgi:hypothetical protein